MGNDEGYGVKWKNHVEDIFGQVRKLRTRDHYSDVILHCGGRNFRAHRVILAAASTFFERLLATAPRERSQVLVMTECHPGLFESLLSFVYDGETYVSAEELEEFMRMAEKLGVRGLRKKDATPAAGGNSLELFRNRKFWSSLHGLGRIGAIRQVTLN
jgi:hypothetical protein